MSVTTSLVARRKGSFAMSSFLGPDVTPSTLHASACCQSPKACSRKVNCQVALPSASKVVY